MAFFTESGLAPPGADDLPFCRNIKSVPQPRLYSAGKIARGLVSRWPLTVINYTSGRMKQALETITDGASFDLVHIDIIHMAGYEELLRRKLPGARIVYNWHNIESELMWRYSEGAVSYARKVYARATARRLAALEQHILQTAYGHVVCSERERQRLLEVVPGAHIEVIENGVDTAYFKIPEESAPDRRRVVFVGSMNYHANVEAAVFFTRQIWPGVRERFPEWILTVVGSNPAPAVLELGSEPGVEVTGTVDDVRPYYREAAVAIVPLLTGSGTRLKILEAMAAGVPVVSTALGMEGLAVTPGEHLLAAESREEWLEAMATAVERRDSLTRAARALVESRYDWDALGAKLYKTYNLWMEQPGVTRRAS